MARFNLLVVALVVIGASRVARADRLIEGAVYVDQDRSGTFSAGDAPVAGVAVFYETIQWAITDAQGHYDLTAPDPGGIVWARVPDGYRPGPVWQEVPGAVATTVDLALVPAEADGQLTFVDASDTHSGIPDVSRDDFVDAIEQANDRLPPPHFFVITGDISQSNDAAELETIADALGSVPTPFVPVPGNHDWHDGGATYRRLFGPPDYSFDARGVHCIVINDSETVEERSAFVAADVSLLTDDRPVIAFTHAPPGPEVTTMLEDAGVNALFTGHLHSNRILQHDTMIEFNTQPLVMGGIDQTPAGYRVVTIEGNGNVDIEEHTTVSDAVVSLVSPLPGHTTPAGSTRLLVAVELGARRPKVRARVDGGAWLDLGYQGGWLYGGDVELTGGSHAIEVEVDGDDQGALASRSYTVWTRATAAPVPLACSDWPQIGGDGSHAQRQEHEIAPPLHVLWASAVGDNLHGGSPTVAGGRVFVPLADFGDGTRGGVVALDLKTGRELWRYRVGFGVRGTPAVGGGLVVFGSLDGGVHAVDAATGAPRWEYALRPDVEPQVRSYYGSPAITGDIVIAGIQREMVALELTTGQVLWSATPRDSGGWFSSHASPAVSTGVAVASFSRGDGGVTGWDVATGANLWRTDGIVSQGLEPSPVIADGLAFVGNELTELYALDLATGEIRWSRRLSDDSFDWGYGLHGTPAYANGTLFVPSQHTYLYALDAASGAVEWTARADPGMIHTAHYRSAVAAFGSNPVVTGELVWIGAADGYLRAFDTTTGELATELFLGSPVMSGPTPAGDTLVVATYDGLVRAFVPDRVPPTTGDGRCPTGVTQPVTPDGCGCDGSGGPSGALLLLLVVAPLLRPR